MADVRDDVINFAMAANGTNLNKHVETAFSIMRFHRHSWLHWTAFSILRCIVTGGWSIYALGHVFCYCMAAVADDVLNFQGLRMPLA